MMSMGLSQSSESLIVESETGNKLIGSSKVLICQTRPMEF